MSEKLVDHRFVLNEVVRLHGQKMDFDEGDLNHRLDRFDAFVVRAIPISSINLDEFSLDEEKVAAFKAHYLETGTYPPIVFDSISGAVIDGYHRANALAQLGLTSIESYVGTEQHLDPSWCELSNENEDEDDPDDSSPERNQSS